MSKRPLGERVPTWLCIALAVSLFAFAAGVLAYVSITGNYTRLVRTERPEADAAVTVAPEP